MSRLIPPNADPITLGQIPAPPAGLPGLGGDEAATGTYRTLHLVATSAESLPDAIENALARASSLVPGVDWFELTELRGSVADGKVGRWMVGVKVGYRPDTPGTPRA